MDAWKQGIERKHQFEGSDFLHHAQRPEKCDIRGYVRGLNVLNDDNELGEHGGCDSREYLHDHGMAVFYINPRYPTPDP